MQKVFLPRVFVNHESSLTSRSRRREHKEISILMLLPASDLGVKLANDSVDARCK
jgi:hypothetical protein